MRRVRNRGNHGLSPGIWSTTGTGNDDINTVENVFVQDAEPGESTIELKALEINEDGHVQTTGEPFDADFGLVVSGVSPIGNCTLPDESEIVTDRVNCLAHSGTYLSDVVSCNPCPNCQ